VARLIQVLSQEGPDGAGSRHRAPVEEAADVVRRGGLVGFPTDTVYGLGANALNPVAVARVYEVKRRPLDSPLIVLLGRIEDAAALVRELPRPARALMERFWPGPLSIVLERSPLVPEITAGGGRTIALRVPGRALTRDFVQACGSPVTAPSANKSGRPSPLSAQDVLADLGAEIEAVLDAGPSPSGLESTVLDLTAEPAMVLRPGPIALEQLEPYCGRLVLQSGHRTGGRPAGPTLPLVLVNLPPGPATARRAWEIAGRELANGRRPGLLLTEEGLREGPPQEGGAERGARQGGREGPVVASLGPAGDLAALAGRLYPALRELEASGCEVIVAEPVPRVGLGLAIMSRLEKTAVEVVEA
jgi:L-threonylcarbamoyladenylate synthase